MLLHAKGYFSNSILLCFMVKSYKELLTKSEGIVTVEISVFLIMFLHFLIISHPVDLAK